MSAEVSEWMQAAQERLMEIRNLAHKGWLDRPNAEFLFREIGKKAQQTSEIIARHCPRAPAPEAHICDSPNYTDGPCYACAREKLMKWVFERYENCLRLAKGKTGDDKQGWLEDADHFLLLLTLLGGKRAASAPSNRVLTYVLSHWGHTEMFGTERHLTDALDEIRVFDERCPRCKFDRWLEDATG